jgi:hypothetical protein
MRWTRILSLVVLFLVPLSLHAACGVERWSIKTGTDSLAPNINLGSYISTTIYNMRSSTAPGSLPNSRIAPRETNQYQVGGTLTKYVREGDSDYHLVIQDGSGRTMIIEIPSPNCVGTGSPFGPGVANARRQFDARFTATTSFKTTSTPVTIKGIGFWDFLHGQTGVAPNGIEVHPVLNITFGASALAPSVNAAGLLGDAPIDPSDDVRYPADVIRDEDGGRVRVFRGGEPLGDALFHGGAVVEDPSIHVVFVGSGWSDQSKRAIMQQARGINHDAGFEMLGKYGVRNFGMRVSTTEIRDAGNDLGDLDVQRLLANAVESGRIQHLDENTIYLVALAPGMDASVASSRDWLSYHSEFHPSELPMRYVVVRTNLDAGRLSEAINASVFRALANPAGNGWF